MASVINRTVSDTLKSEMFRYSDLPYGNSIYLTTGFKLNDVTCLEHDASQKVNVNSRPNKLKKLKKRRNMRPMMFDKMMDVSDSSCRDHTRSCEHSGQMIPKSLTTHISLKDGNSISTDLKEGPERQNCPHYSSPSEKSDTGFTDTYEDRSCGTDCESFVTEISSLEAGIVVHASSFPLPRRFVHTNLDSNWETDSCITDHSSFEVQQYGEVPSVKLSAYARFCVDDDVTGTSLCSVERETTLESVSDDNEHESDTGSFGSTISGFSQIDRHIQSQCDVTNKDDFIANMSRTRISEELSTSSEGTHITEKKHKSSLTCQQANRKFKYTKSSSESVNFEPKEFSAEPNDRVISKNVSIESDECCNSSKRNCPRYDNQCPLLQPLQGERFSRTIPRDISGVSDEASSSLSRVGVGSKHGQAHEDTDDGQSAGSSANHDWIIRGASLPKKEYSHTTCPGSNDRSLNGEELTSDMQNVINERISVAKQQQQRTIHETRALPDSPRHRSHFFVDVKLPRSQEDSSHRSASLPNVYFGLGRTTKCPWHYNYHVQELCLNTSCDTTSGLRTSGLCHFDTTLEQRHIKHKHKHPAKPQIHAYRYKCKMNTPHPDVADTSNVNRCLSTRRCDPTETHRQDGRERCHDDENRTGFNHSRNNRDTRIQISHFVSPRSQIRQASEVVEPVSVNMRRHIPNPYNKLNHRFHSTLHCPCFIFFCFLCCYPAVFLMQRSDIQFISNQEDLARQNAKRSTVLYIIGGVTSVIFLSTLLFVMYFFLGDKLMKTPDSY